MNFNIDIEGMAAAALSSALDPDRISELLRNKMVEVVESAINDQFSWRSDFQKLLATEIAKAMPTEVEGLGRFSDVVVKAVTESVNAHQSEFVQKAVADRLKSMLKPLPGQMKLSDVVQQIIDAFDEHDRDGSESPTVIFERSSGSTSGYAQLYIDPRSGRDRYGCKFNARLHPVEDDNHDVLVCWALEMDDGKLENKRFIGPAFNAEALLLNLYTGQVSIEVDQTNFDDVYYSSEIYD
jgi:hypothetical protein